MSDYAEEREIVEDVWEEYVNAIEKFEIFPTTHHGFAVIKEEVDELWEEVKKKEQKAPERKRRMKLEAVQIAAMAIRFIKDLC